MGGVTPRTRNPLLQKDDVGRSKPTCYDLPEDQFAYGRPGNQDLEGAREVSMHWVSHTPSRPPLDHAPDWVYHNRRAAGSKVLQARDMKHFRRERDLLHGGPPGDLSAHKGHGSQTARDIIPSDVVPGFTYGRKVRPSTPVQEVISHRFGEQAEQELNRFYADFHEAQEQLKTHVRKIPLTTASRGHASVAKKMSMQEQPKELFKIGKFKRATSKVDTRHRKHVIRDDVSDLTDDFSDVEKSMTGRGLVSTDYGGAQGADYFETPLVEEQG